MENENSMDIMEEMKEIDAALVKHSAVRFNYGVLNPINRKEEFEKFKEDKTYDPQLQYNDFDAAYHEEELKNLSIPKHHLLTPLFEEIRHHLLIEAKALQRIGTKKFDVRPIFQPITGKVLQEARNILLEPEVHKVKEEKTISAEELAKIMKQELQKYDCRGWTIRLSENAASRMSVSAGNKKITIAKKEKFSTQDVTKLIRHEIGTHVLRSENGEAQDLKVCAIGLPQYLATEEGLAVFNEQQSTTKNIHKLKYLARQALLTYYASNLGFAETFNLIRDQYSSDWLCFKSVIRAKRGLGDTSRPGGYLKDHLYLQGKLMIDEYVKKGRDISLLYAGKIGIEHVHLVEEGLFKPAKVLPDFL